MVDTKDGVHAAASELGIDLNSLDESSDLETTVESTEAEGEVKEEAVKDESSAEASLDESINPDDEENKEASVETAEVVEEPKLTVKEFREIEAAKESLEAERKAFMEQRASMEKEFQEKYHEKVKTHDQMDDFFAHLADKDPELFDLLKGEYQEHEKQFNNPVIAKLREEQQSLRQELSQFKNKASDEVTLTKLDAEMNKFNSTIGKEAEAAGLKIDRKVIEDMWTKGLTVEEAFYAKYGASFAKASASKAKVETAEKKVAARPTVSTAGSVSRSNSSTQAQVPKDAFGAVHHFAKQYLK